MIRTLKQALLLTMAGGMLTPMLSAQSVWQKMKQSVKQAEQNAQAQQRKKQATSAKSSSPSAAAANGAASTDAAIQTSPPADLSSPAMKALYQKLDVGGVQLGMTSQAAQTALQSRNRALVKGQVQPFVFTDLPKTDFTSHDVYNATQPQYEVVTLGLTLQPMQPQVEAIGRETRYEIEHQPTGENTVAALQAKYGPETTRTDSVIMHTISLQWIFDGEGNQIPKSQAKKFVDRFLSNSCPMTFQEPGSGYIGRGLRPGWDANCAPYTILKAELNLTLAAHDTHGRSLPPGLVRTMGVSLVSLPLFTKTVETTRKMVLDAKAANLQKNKKAADQNVPTL
jgi:hypothetical protein